VLAIDAEPTRLEDSPGVRWASALYLTFTSGAAPGVVP
jgi:hypothetical protein